MSLYLNSVQNFHYAHTHYWDKSRNVVIRPYIDKALSVAVGQN